MSGFIWVLGITYWLGLYIGNVWLCYTIAEQKNRNEVWWGWLAVFFGIPVTLLIIGFRPLKTTMIQRNFARAAREREETKEWKSPDMGLPHLKK